MCIKIVIFLCFLFRKTRHLDELSSTVKEYADAVNILTLNVSFYSFYLNEIFVKYDFLPKIHEKPPFHKKKH